MDASGYGRIGEGVIALIFTLGIICAISVTLGLWKLFDIIMWATSHIHIS